MLKENIGQPEQDYDLNYFVCTLGQAAAINAEIPHSWKTVNDFIDHQAEKHPDRPAAGFPVPPVVTIADQGWDFVIFSMCSGTTVGHHQVDTRSQLSRTSKDYPSTTPLISDLVFTKMNLHQITIV